MVDPFDRFRSALADRYRIETELGAGGMATVHLATDLKHHRQVALKLLRPDYGAAIGRDRFLREIDTLSRLRHPHILPLLDSGAVDDEFLFFVMPYCEGETLRQRLEREGQLPIEDTLQYASEVAEALAYAHRHGVVHRDVKPQNIMIDSGHAVLADFGIAIATDVPTSDRLTSAGHSPGTPHYMSPEQTGPGQRIDARSDIYSLGCVVYEMLVGQPPFTGPNLLAIMARHAFEPPPRIRTVRDTVPESLEDVVLRTLAKAPADRFRTASELTHALKDVSTEHVRTTGRFHGSGNGGPAGGEVMPGAAAERAEVRSVSALVQRGLLAALGAVVLLTLIGFLAVNAFDAKVDMPARFSPSRSDYLVVGARAMLGPIVVGLILLAVFLLGQQLLRGVVAGLGHTGATGQRLEASIDRRRARWQGFWQSVRPEAVADAFFVVAALMSGVVLMASWPLISGHFTDDTSVFGCVSRPLQRSLFLVSTGLIVGLAYGWVSVFGWLKRRYGKLPRGLARWGSAAVILLMVIVVTLPWRLMWSGGDERVLIDGERGYLLGEASTHVILHNAERRTTTVYSPDALPRLQRLGVSGLVFEEAEAFHSGAPDCTALD